MVEPEQDPRSAASTAKKLALVCVRLVLFNLFFVALLFGSAGRLNWDRAWIFLVLVLATFGFNFTLAYLKNPELIRERWKKREGTKPFDKVFAVFYVLGLIGLPVVAGLDAGRFGWSAVRFEWLYLGAALHVLGDIPVLGALLCNPHLESTVRIQEDRGHKVATTGPYRFVRHPMYTGIIVMFSGWPLVLGSLWAYAVVGAITVMFIVRTALEDRTLTQELEGYQEYARRTRYRLVPGLW